MSNERIDQILEENGVRIEGAMKKRIIKSMEQYALEASKDGFCAGSDAVHKLLRPEIDRLQDLVQAQKELIAIYEKAITLGDPDVWELYSKIQKLEK